MHIYLKKQRGLIICFKKLEKKANKSQSNNRNEIIYKCIEINGMEKRKLIQKTNKSKSCFKFNKINRPPARLKARKTTAKFITTRNEGGHHCGPQRHEGNLINDFMLINVMLHEMYTFPQRLTWPELLLGLDDLTALHP